MKKKLTHVSRKLRNNLTEAERHLWYELRSKKLGVKFRRQAVIGKYIVDFASFDVRLVVEIDGGQHAENPDDFERDKGLREQGFEILRFWNNDVLRNREGVLQRIVDYLKIPPPSPQRGREILEEIEEDKMDYFSALDVKKKNKKWTPHKDLKKTLGL